MKLKKNEENKMMTNEVKQITEKITIHDIEKTKNNKKQRIFFMKHKTKQKHLNFNVNVPHTPRKNPQTKIIVWIRTCTFSFSIYISLVRYPLRQRFAVNDCIFLKTNRCFVLIYLAI